jgi:hypothetical protein
MELSECPLLGLELQLQESAEHPTYGLTMNILKSTQTQCFENIGWTIFYLYVICTYRCCQAQPKVQLSLPAFNLFLVCEYKLLWQVQICRHRKASFIVIIISCLQCDINPDQAVQKKCKFIKRFCDSHIQEATIKEGSR